MSVEVAEKRAHYQLTFAVLALAAMAFSILQSLIIPAIPSLEHSLHVVGRRRGLAAHRLPAQRLDLPRRSWAGSATCWARRGCWWPCCWCSPSGTLISALATTFPVMLVGRVIQGAGGAIFPLAFGIIRDEFPRERVVGAIGILSSILGIGTGLGIVLAGPIIVHLNYHWLFWVPLVLCVVATVTTVVLRARVTHTDPRAASTRPGRSSCPAGWWPAWSPSPRAPIIGWGDTSGDRSLRARRPSSSCCGSARRTGRTTPWST